MPQNYDWRTEAQVDWYETEADLGGERQRLQVFSLRKMASGGAFHRPYLTATQQAFLKRTSWPSLLWWGLPPSRYDNLKAALKKILYGYQCAETARFIAFRSHRGC